MTQQPFGGAGRLDTRGAVDLGALAQAREAQAKAKERAEAAASGGDGAANGPALVIEVGEADFQAEVVDRSMTVPVVIDFWAEWCEPCKQLSPILEKLAQEYDGRWVLAKIDVDAEQRLAQAFQVQSIPSLFAVVGGQPLPLFQGAVPEAQVRQVLDELLKVAAENGIAGRVVAGDAPPTQVLTPAVAAEPVDTELDDAADAFERGDLDAAEAAYRALLARVPEPPGCRGRAGDPGPHAAHRWRRRRPGGRGRGCGSPTRSTRSCVAADALVLQARAREAIDLLVAAVRRTAGQDRDRLRTHLVELFDLLGADHPDVAPGAWRWPTPCLTATGPPLVAWITDAASANPLVGRHWYSCRSPCPFGRRPIG